MWTDRDTPGCIHDTIDCSNCGACNPSPLELYLEDLKEKEKQKDTEDEEK